jgi:hypothetical protein
VSPFFGAAPPPVLIFSIFNSGFAMPDFCRDGMPRQQSFVFGAIKKARAEARALNCSRAHESAETSAALLQTRPTVQTL